RFNRFAHTPTLSAYPVSFETASHALGYALSRFQRLKGLFFPHSQGSRPGLCAVALSALSSVS
ncbi:MAG: hypothetical protein JSU96_03280, partial [Acidobacteriota bacterium]